MIRSWANNETEDVWNNIFVKKLPPKIQRVAKRKLIHINSAMNIDDLRVPPGNRLEKLSGNRKNSWSVRVNDQWRICFLWENGNAFDVSVEDYH